MSAMRTKSIIRFLLASVHWLIFVLVGYDLLGRPKEAYLDPQFKVIALVAIFFVSTYVTWLFFDARTGILLLQFWIFNSVFFVLTPIAVISNQSSWFVNRNVEQSTKIDTFYFVLAALFVAFLGSISKVNRAPYQKNVFTLSFMKFRYFLGTYLVLFAAILLFRRDLMQEALIDYRSNRIVNPISPMQIGLSKAFFIAVPMILVLVLFRIDETLGKTFKRVITLTLVTILFIFANPLGNSRQTFLLGFLPLAFAISRRSVLWQRIIAFSIWQITVFGQPVSYAITHSAQNVRLLGWQGIFEGNSFRPSSTLTTGDFDSFGMLATGLTHFGSHSVGFPLEQIVGVVFFWVPRSLWAGKPMDTAVVVANAAGFKFQNLSAPWLLELLANGGLLLMLVGAFVIPRLLKKVDHSSQSDDLFWLLNYLLIGSEFILLRGSLLQAAGVVLFGSLVCRCVVKKV